MKPLFLLSLLFAWFAHANIPNDICAEYTNALQNTPDGAEALQLEVTVGATADWRKRIYAATKKVSELQAQDVSEMFWPDPMCSATIPELKILWSLTESLESANKDRKKQVTHLLKKYLKTAIAHAGTFFEKKTQVDIVGRMARAEVIKSNASQLSDLAELLEKCEKAKLTLQASTRTIAWPPTAADFQKLEASVKKKMVRHAQLELKITDGIRRDLAKLAKGLGL